MSGGAGFTGALRSRLATAERNIAVNTLRDIIAAGWAYLLMVSGIADEFEDQTGVDDTASTGETYDAGADCYKMLGSYADLIPAMSAATTSGVSMSASTTLAANSPWKAADNNNVNAWLATTTTGWLEVDFGSPGAVSRYSIKNASAGLANYDLRAPRDWTLEGYNGSGWDVLDTRAGVTGWGDGVANTYSLSAPATYQRFRLNVTANNGAGDLGICEIELLERVPAPDMTLVSEAFSAEAQPNTARAVLLHEPVDSVTLDADCTIEASRDGGTTWATGALSDQGAFDVTTNILAAEIDLSGQPAGTSMKWRFKGLNGREQTLHGVWLQWG